jgi:hypothetical protein
VGQHITSFHVMWGCVHFFVAQFPLCVNTVNVLVTWHLGAILL